MTSAVIIGSIFVVLGAMQIWQGYLASQREHRVRMMTMGAGLAAVGASRLLEGSTPALRIAVAALATVFWMAAAFNARREFPRLALFIATLMSLSFVLTVFDALGYLDSVSPRVERAFVLIFLAALAAGGVWAVFTLVRAVRHSLSTRP
jgi:hypothetical protein